MKLDHPKATLDYGRKTAKNLHVHWPVLRF